MRIIIDGHYLPGNVRVSRDLLITLKNVAKNLKWGIRYDATRELVLINSKDSSVPPLPVDKPNEERVEESARLANKVFCLDPGHGGSDPGSLGPAGTAEKDHTLAIALLLRDKLEKNGATVIMTRDSDKDVAYPDAIPDEELRVRVSAANDAEADLFISIHNDSFTSKTAVGTTTFHYGDRESVQLAKLVQECIGNRLGTKDRGSRFASFYTLRYTDMPAILVEVAFISNPVEEMLLSSTDGRENAADSICEGIMKYYKV
ncbi:MAG TPA: N-acetylmuramoyl-L-alanine amidase [Methylomusa anaerophila]|uniref:N-acetylmuramoyl-L-alanine amidase AmiC n=1 Tax=Methylomusa anaerophila TaxID=1930071 RepID=A0A348ANG6_9FIRM|nr:N-acetylmuramoyl-L-alanine amidase [Methylomusa anaerophila]BBB92614.1 N-acetylmuramoyl-L-alanine amidase AmiC precursor [Methylomusa anaerophila]HML87532.1 N-acetylmuramoyl-L-alanine amidase [Methylomusa anaerophila]